MHIKMRTLLHDIRIGVFIGWRMFRRANIWTTTLIVFVMSITFLNMVAVSGILVGLIEGGNIANREQYTGDLIVTRVSGTRAISETPQIIETLKNSPLVEGYSVRYLSGAQIEANFDARDRFDRSGDTAGGQLAGIDVTAEDALTQLSKYVVEGAYLENNDSGKILVGANYLRRYSSSFGDGFDSLDKVYPGDKVRVTVGNRTENYIVKGIIDSKVNEVSLRLFIPISDYIRMVDISDLGAGEIAVKLTKDINADTVKKLLINQGFEKNGKIQTAIEAIPDFLNQIKIAFGVLGSIIGFVGVIVASVTIFIVIFINAVARQRQIGVLKAIGVRPRVLQFAYILQSIFYATLGILLASIIIYGVLVPGLEQNPIDFPFSDGILSAPIATTIRRAVVLLTVSALAGMIPAWLIVRKNTLASITGR